MSQAPQKALDKKKFEFLKTELRKIEPLKRTAPLRIPLENLPKMLPKTPGGGGLIPAHIKERRNRLRRLA